MRFERFTTKHDQEVNLSDFNILVGPNNTGKSQTLSDLHSIGTSRNNENCVILSEAEINHIESSEELEEEFDIVEEPENNRKRIIGRGPSHQSNSQATINNNQWGSAFNQQFFRQHLGQLYIDYLDASSRVGVANETDFFNPHGNRPNGPVQGLYAVKKLQSARDVEAKLQEAFSDAFDDEIILDDSGGEDLRFKVTEEFNDDIPDDLVDAFPVMEQYDQLDDEGHGYRSFVAVVLFMLLSENRVLLLDEPEAFLHPAQARELGQWLASHAQSIPGQVVIATHNSNFVSGILTENEGVNIYRLAREGDQTTYHRISSEVASDLENKPLLSSQRVVEGVFHEGVVVCEGDDDSAVYESVCQNILEESEFLFVNTHGKGAVKKVVEVLNDSPIPVAAITDLDMIRRRNQFEQLLESLDAHEDELMRTRDEIADRIEDQDDEELLELITDQVGQFAEQLDAGEHSLSGANSRLREIQRTSNEWSEVKKQGIQGVPDKIQEDVEEVVDEASDRGLFLVPRGELESWFSFESDHLTKTEEMLGKIQNENCDEELVAFIRKIVDYLKEQDPAEV